MESITPRRLLWLQDCVLSAESQRSFQLVGIRVLQCGRVQVGIHNVSGCMKNKPGSHLQGCPGTKNGPQEIGVQHSSELFSVCVLQRSFMCLADASIVHLRQQQWCLQLMHSQSSTGPAPLSCQPLCSAEQSIFATL